ncbi:MAG: vWA domain-containing protein [Clostridia bacterium]|nr:vWA domain-containing protein [Clostridia bacterium]
MKNNNTELVFILDRSGSMHGMEKDTIGGFNSLIEKQKKLDGKCYVSTVLFDHETEVIHDRVELQEIKPMTERDYEVRGSTALLDALGSAIHHIGNIHKYAREEDVPQNTMFVIITDGMENASRQYSYSSVKSMIERQKVKYGWDFIYLAANIDAAENAARFGIDESRAVDYNCDSDGMDVVYGAVCEAVSNARMNAPMSDEWRKSVDRDFEARGRKRKR